MFLSSNHITGNSISFNASPRQLHGFAFPKLYKSSFRLCLIQWKREIIHLVSISSLTSTFIHPIYSTSQFGRYWSFNCPNELLICTPQISEVLGKIILSYYFPSMYSPSDSHCATVYLCKLPRGYKKDTLISFSLISSVLWNSAAPWLPCSGDNICLLQNN